ncbi:MAG: signal peptidase I [Bacteroidia bacterium]
MPLKRIRNSKVYSIPVVRIGLLFVLSWFLFVFIKQFFFDLYKVGGDEMRPFLKENDIVLIDKFNANYKIGDVCLYKIPDNDTLNFDGMAIQRVIAGPGDSLEIIDKIVHRNGKALEEKNVKYNYFLDLDSGKIDSNLLIRLRITEGGIVSKSNKYSLTLSKFQLDSLKQKYIFKNITSRFEKPGLKDPSVFPYADKYAWNKDQFGKIYIPKKGDVLQIDTSNIYLYFHLIHENEKNTIKVDEDKILINGVAAKQYEVKHNYYFFMCDNRDNGMDCRNWGYIPDYQIEGRTVRVINE